MTYVYTKQQADQGTVTVKYQDAHGQDLLPPLTLTGQVGTDYQTTACEIPNYKLRTVQGSQLGKFTSDEQTIIYQYEQLASDPFKPEPTPTPTDEPGNQKPGLLQVPESLLETIDNSLTEVSTKKHPQQTRAPRRTKHWWRLPQTGAAPVTIVVGLVGIVMLVGVTGLWWRNRK
ncbi:MucBP domain-containing protein [Fructilactobacillus florum]|uniref:MucBP domain-containing protein n=1 Tax=Fructilactobacillus florum TaxID=640331 RepID=UPI0006D1829C|nr:MucBP domain-containing protein [Fructilactobacillus florum]